MPWVFARQIVEEHSVEERVNELCDEFSRFEAAYDALKWLLARKCNTLESLRRTVDGVQYNLYRQASDPVADTPEILVLYTHDDDQVNIIGIDGTEAAPEFD